ncbi:hypothetical protein REPUB_Repub06bG0092600 [Reevesia pubescens]
MADTAMSLCCFFGGLELLCESVKVHNVNVDLPKGADKDCSADYQNMLSLIDFGYELSLSLEEQLMQSQTLLEFTDTKVQIVAVGALRTLAFKNDENKNQIVECNALSALILMLRSEDAAIHYEVVGVIGNLVHSSPNIKKKFCFKLFDVSFNCFSMSFYLLFLNCSFELQFIQRSPFLLINLFYWKTALAARRAKER